jgi:hypothetical protein
LLEEIRAFYSPGGFGANFTNLIYALQVTVRLDGLAPNVDHTARRFDKSSFTNVMAGFLLVDH